MAARDRALFGGAAEIVEVRIARGAGSGSSSLALTLKSGADGAVLAVFARDLTALRDSEERLAAAETRLHELRRLESIALLAGGIMHHVNNLFCVSMGYLKMLADEVGETGPGRGYLQEVQGATDRAADLVRQLLGLARDPDPTGSVEVVGAVKRLELLIRQLVTEQVDFKVELPAAALPEVRAGRAQLEQLIVNLAFAAREAMPDGGDLRVRVALAQDAVELAFAHRARPRRPGPHVQLVEPLPGWASRFGLGYAQQIVALVGGELVVTTSPDGFTTRSALLPRRPPSETTDEVPPAPPQGQETILVVEDEEKLRALIVRSLKRQGYELLVASDGDEAMRVARAHPAPIHLLLTDIVMPGLSGVDVAATLRTHQPNLRVLFISGHGEAAFPAETPLPPRTSVLQKPFRPASLTQHVRTMLDES